MAHVRGTRKRTEAEFANLAAQMSDALEAAGDHTAVIADENLIGNQVFSPEGETIFDWAAWLLPILESAFRGVKIEHVFLTREREPWLRSCYAQAVRLQGETRDWKEWYAAVPPGMDWARGEAQIRSAVRGSVTFLDLKDDLFGDSPGTTVLDRLRVPTPVRETLVRTMRRYNVTPSDAALERRRACNATAPADTIHRGR